VCPRRAGGHAGDELLERRAGGAAGEQRVFQLEQRPSTASMPMPRKVAGLLER
jgi:hypothetical protein